MKKFFVILIVVALVTVFASSAFAARPDHPYGPPSMPDQSVGGLHKAVFEVPAFPYHIVRGLMLLTDVEAPHPPCE